MTQPIRVESLPLLALVLAAAPVLVLAWTSPAAAQRKAPSVFGEFDGDPMYTVLEPDAIPAIRDPDFVAGDAAAAQMSPNEPVIGVVIGDEAHAYSTWQLDAHEIVNDRIGGTAIAATW